MGFETDHRTLPHEVGWIGAGVHLAKGCYRGQEAVARVHNLGKPPRRLALAHIDGSEGVTPAHGDEVLVDDRVVGWVGTAAQHHELGPVATVIVKRSADPNADLLIRAADGDVVASQEVVVVP
jgi:folate-binding protein YgfZ